MRTVKFICATVLNEHRFLCLLLIHHAVPLPPPTMTQQAYFDTTGRVATPVYKLGALPIGAAVPGPAILIDDISTIVVEPQCTAHVTVDHNVRIDVQQQGKTFWR